MLLNRTRADELMDAHGLSAIVCSTNTNVYYASGWATYASWHFGDMALVVLPRDHSREPAVITVEVDAGQPQQYDGTWMQVLRTYRRRPGTGPGGSPVAFTDGEVSEPIPLDHAEVIAAYLGEIGLTSGAVAFDDRGLGLDVAARMPGLLVREGKELMRDIRMVKTVEEVRLMRAATRKTEAGIEIVMEALAAGATCAEAERVFWTAIPLTGARPVFLLITPFRPGVGRLAKSETLQPGDTVTVDATAAVRHYTSDVGRTAVIGQPSVAQLESYNAVRAGWRSVLEQFQPGAHSADLERAVVAAIQAHGNLLFTGASIHSVGLEHTDHPHPGNALSPFTIADGSVLSCDLPWSDVGIGRFHLENLVHLNNGAVELLDTSDTSLYACVDGRALRVE